MSLIRLLFLFLLSFTIHSSGLAQQAAGLPQRIRFEHLTAADGLPENSVTCMIQDHLGFIWMGTLNGLARYDGTQMAVFQYNPKNKYSFRGRSVEALYEDRNGDVWIGAEILVRFERSTGRFIEYPRKNLEPLGSKNFVHFIYGDRRGDIWTISGDEMTLNRLHPQTATWTYFRSGTGRRNPKEPKGLASNTVYLSNTNGINHFAFLETQSGTIWVTTKGDAQNTLHFFDTKTDQFNQFMPRASLAIATDFQRITGIAEDQHGQLYLSSYAYGTGIFRLNPKTGQVTQFKHVARNPSSLRSDSVTRVHIGRDGLVWVPTYQGLDRLDPKTGQFTHFLSSSTGPNSPNPGLLKFLHETPEGDLWFKSSEGLIYYDYRRQQFVRYLETNDPDGIEAGNNIVSFLADRTGLVWIGTANSGVYKQSRIPKFTPLSIGVGSTSTEATNSIQTLEPYAIYEAPSEPGVLWIGSPRGLDRFDQKTGRQTSYRYDPRNSTSIGKGNVWAIAEDKKGRLWVGTWEGGLNLLDRKRGTFTHFSHDHTRSNSLTDGGIRSVFPASDGTIWVGTLEGLNQFDPDRQTFTHYYKADSTYPTALYDRIQPLMNLKDKVASIMHPGNNVNKTVEFTLNQSTRLLIVGAGEWGSTGALDYGWLEDERGKRLWEMTDKQSAGDGMPGRNRNQIGIIHLQAGKYQLRYRSSNSYAYGHWEPGPPYHPELWGIQCFAVSASEGESVSQLARQRQLRGLSSDAALSLREDAQKRLWIGTFMGGLQMLNPKTGETKAYLADVKGMTNAMSIQSILDDARPNYFWVADYGTGLWLLDDTGQVHKHYTRANGLPNNTVYSLQYDTKGNLWAGTGNGLVRFNPKTEQFRYFTQRNELPSVETYRICKTHTNLFYVGGNRGIVTVDPAHIDDDTLAPPVVLTDLLINGQPATIGSDGQLPSHILVTKEITLPHDQTDLTFLFTTLSYSRGNESQYAFKLAPLDTAWVAIGTTRQARFLDLQPGTYTFQVKAANADGVWNQKGTSIQITIRPPWWRTWWAYLFYVLVLAGGIWSYIQYRSRVLRLENQRLEEKVAERTNEVQQQKEEIETQRDYLEETLNELKITQTQLIQKEKLASLGELTAGIAHEIQNPLNFVNNFSEVSTELIDELKEGPFQKLPDDEKDYADEILGDLTSNLKKINHHGGRASSIVKGMLEHSRTDSGEKRPTDLNALADEYLKIAYHGLRAKDKNASTDRFNCELITKFDPTLELVTVAPQEIGRVLLNLYNNAFHAVSERSKQNHDPDYKPKVEVCTTRESNYVVIWVRDNGIGIPESIKAKVFQPFFTTKPTGEGTGLGLSLSYDIITKGHGGKLLVESTQNQGTEFSVHIPVT
ncbi:sensor histidine kinase [Spirosoma flavus]